MSESFFFFHVLHIFYLQKKCHFHHLCINIWYVFYSFRILFIRSVYLGRIHTFLFSSVLLKNSNAFFAHKHMHICYMLYIYAIHKYYGKGLSSRHLAILEIMFQSTFFLFIGISFFFGGGGGRAGSTIQNAASFINIRKKKYLLVRSE